jgi:DNA-binding NtrC family response regulator
VGNTTERTSSSERRTDGVAVHRLLFLVTECARPLAGGARIALGSADEVVVGRADRRQVTRTREGGRTVVRVSVPDRKMSSDHARILLGPEVASLEDLASTNGTTVDGVPAGRLPLRSGSVLELGRSLFVYREVIERRTLRAPDIDGDGDDGEPPGLATLDPVLAERVDRLKRIAPSPVTVMLLGETGTGKEITARAVHTLSRRPGPFVAINCGAIPAALVEGQLFGHVKGAFSGAVRDEQGLVRAAQFGTLFLDEIGDLPAASQAALLRVLQEGEVMPVGATRAAPVDIRVVCATHRPLDDLMDRGDFRRDLYGRLAGFTHTIPPLRERRADLGLLVAALLRSPKVRDGERLRLRPDAARAMLRYDWPLNVRELGQCLATASVLADEGVIRLEDLPPPIAELAAAPPSSTMSAAEGTQDRDEALRRELLMRLAETRGNMSEVARAMGKARQQVQRWVRRLGIDPDAFREPVK